MAKRASGKYAYLIDDRSGRKIRYKDARTEWNGLRVHKNDWEPKQTLLDPPHLGPEATSLSNPRPDNDVDLTTVKFGSLFGRGTPPIVSNIGTININVSEVVDSTLLQTAFSIPTIATGYTLLGETLTAGRGAISVNTAEDADSQLIQTAFGSFNFSAQENTTGENLTSTQGDPVYSASSTQVTTGESLTSGHGSTGLNFSGTEVPAGIELSSNKGTLSFQISSTLAASSPASTTGFTAPTINTIEDVGGLQLSSGFGIISIAIDETGWGSQTWGSNAWGT
tara:strand:- start:1014 stop:1856 length:843 start_codon:yes stop_codon:yes gene_type:complete